MGDGAGVRVVELGQRKLCSTCCKFGLEMPRYESFRRQETNRQKNNAANVGRGERERMTKRESGVECVLTRGRCGQRSGISHARLHLHILLRIVARLAANRKMRHRQTSRRRSTDRERDEEKEERKRERERESKEEICIEQCWQIMRAKIGLILKAKIAKNCMQKSRKKS